MYNMNTIVSTNFEQLHNNVPQERIESAVSYWEDRDLSSVTTEMPNTQRYGYADIAVVMPDTKDVDETKSILLPLEYNQGVTPAHYMRAKMVQQYVAPDSRVVIVPNSSFDRNHVDIVNGLSDSSKEKMAEGDYRPYAELIANTLDMADKVHSFGSLMIPGSSQGALTGLALASSETLDISGVVAFETPSMSHRDAKALSKDFQKSGGGMTGLLNAIKGSEIKAQKEAMRVFDRFPRDIAKFVIRSSFNADAKLIAKSMAGSAEYLANPAVKALGEGAVNFYYVEGSSVFDPESISDETQALAPVIRLEGPEMYAHASSNNLRLFASVAYNSFKTN